MERNYQELIGVQLIMGIEENRQRELELARVTGQIEGMYRAKTIIGAYHHNCISQKEASKAIQESIHDVARIHRFEAGAPIMVNKSSNVHPLTPSIL